jgi:hypothetical protein
VSHHVLPGVRFLAEPVKDIPQGVALGMQTRVGQFGPVQQLPRTVDLVIHIEAVHGSVFIIMISF